MKRCIEFDYQIGEIVRIREISQRGLVLAQLVEQSGVSFQVAYWNDGTRRVEWMRAEELIALGGES